MDKFICPHCGKELESGRIFLNNDPNYFVSYCIKCDILYYLNGQKEIYLEVPVRIKEKIGTELK